MCDSIRCLIGGGHLKLPRTGQREARWACRDDNPRWRPSLVVGESTEQAGPWYISSQQDMIHMNIRYAETCFPSRGGILWIFYDKLLYLLYDDLVGPRHVREDRRCQTLRRLLPASQFPALDKLLVGVRPSSGSLRFLRFSVTLNNRKTPTTSEWTHDIQKLLYIAI